MKDKEIIFVDTEFSSLDSQKGEILSIGLVKSSGEELYQELEFDGETSDWVKENILPTLTSGKVSKEEAKQKIKEFVGPNKPVMIGFINQFDTIYIYKLFSIEKHPFFWIPLDFASMLYSEGFDPEEYVKNKKEFCGKYGINMENYHEHNALDDAKLLREIYYKIIK